MFYLSNIPLTFCLKIIRERIYIR